MSDGTMHINNEEVKIPVKEISELLTVATQKVPELLTNLMKIVYSEEAGSNMGKAVGTLYKELVNSGIPQPEAIKMANDYMLSLKETMKSVNLGNYQNNK